MTKKERIEALNSYIDGQLWSMEYSRKYADGRNDYTLEQKIEHVRSLTDRYLAQVHGVIQFVTICEGLKLTEQETEDLYRIAYNVYENCNDWSKEFEPYNQ